MVSTYRDAVVRQKDVANGLTTTHEGGEAYALDSLKKVRRFLILGSEGGSFYANERELTNLNIQAVKDALDEHGTKVVDLIVDVSDRGLAPKNDPALVALAMALAYVSDDKAKQRAVRKAAEEALPKVARIGTHLFHFAAYVSEMRGWGETLVRAFASWYEQKSPMALANQVTKYQQRDGWSHRDILRKAHPLASGVKNDIFKYVVSGTVPEGDHDAIAYLKAVETVKATDDVKAVVDLIHAFNLPREVLPTWALNEPKVWDALLHAGKGMPMGALLRNLGNLGKHGLLDPNSDNARFVMDRLSDVNNLRAARIHPIDVIKAKIVYENGAGNLGKGVWVPNHRVVDALEETFYVSFDTVEPTGKRGIIALDVSSSMTWGDIGGIRGFTPRVASAVMAMVTMRVEREFELLAFSHELVPIKLSRHDSLDTVIKTIDRISFGGTYCDLPMRYAKDKGIPADYFAVYTDSETMGRNPSEALRSYRKALRKPDAKLIVVGMVANEFSIADPKDQNMLDVVGFSTDAPAVMSEFIRGTI